MKKRYIYRIGVVFCLAVSLIAGCEKYSPDVTQVSTNEATSKVNTETKVEETTSLEETTQETASENTIIQETTQATQPQEVVSEETIMSVEPVIERFLAQRESYDYYNDAIDSEYAQRIVLSVTEDIIDLEVIAIETEIGDDGQLIIQNEKLLFSKENFTVDDMLVLELEMPEIIPNRAVRFKDGKGNIHLLGIAESGEDGMPILINI